VLITLVPCQLPRAGEEQAPAVLRWLAFFTRFFSPAQGGWLGTLRSSSENLLCPESCRLCVGLGYPSGPQGNLLGELLEFWLLL
jgi:hypothetical protein